MTIMFDRALGALAGGALGDAMGMPTQTLSPRAIRTNYGPIDHFVAPIENHPVSRGMLPGTITDDTEQTLLLGQLLLELDGRPFDQLRWVETLCSWQDTMIARGSLDLLGPSTKRAIAAMRAGVPPDEAGKDGDTNGAAMRIAPVGILCPADDPEHLIEMVAATCKATHNTNLAIAAASAVAAAISTGIAGGSWQEALVRAISAAAKTDTLGHWVAGGKIASRIAWALKLVQGHDRQQAMDLVSDLVGTSVTAQESIPAACAVVQIAQGNVWDAVCISASLGGDTDTIGSIAGSIAGACCGFSELPADKIEELRGFDLASVKSLVAGLVEIRQKVTMLK